MGRKSKKFIDKSSSQHFHLLHRSHTDQAYAGDGVPSEFVLVASNNNNKRVSFEDETSTFVTNKIKSRRDHINELGFLNDGYDYTQHLREMGDGKFISKSGKALDYNPFVTSTKIANLPEDALPSGIEMERDLEAITIDHELMDEDIRLALFDGVDFDGNEFEELQDDFVLQVMQEPSEPDFDFDEHIRKLIERSERKLQPIKVSKDIEEFEEEESYEESEYQEMSSEQRELIENQFSKTLEEYDDDEIGSLGDEELEGELELEGDGNELIDSVMEQFLSEMRDLKFAEGSTGVVKGARSLPKKFDNVDENAEVDLKKAVLEQEMLQQEAVTQLSSYGPADVGIEKCQEYLREEKQEEQWDCESVLSTYSTLDNHPSLIKDPTNSKFQPYKSKYVRNMERVAATSHNNSSNNSVVSGKSNQRPVVANPGRIVLTSKLNIPLGYGPWNKNKSENNNTNNNHKSNKLQIVEEEEESVEDSDTNDDISEEDGNNKNKTILKREKSETPEEKKARKSLVKEQKRLKRLNKKQTKEVIKAEIQKIKPVDNNNFSVFRY